jgi:hypothetical protein
MVDIGHLKALAYRLGKDLDKALVMAAVKELETYHEQGEQGGRQAADRLDRCRDRASHIMAGRVQALEYDPLLMGGIFKKADIKVPDGDYAAAYIAHETEVLAHALLQVERAPGAKSIVEEAVDMVEAKEKT